MLYGHRRRAKRRNSRWRIAGCAVTIANCVLSGRSECRAIVRRHSFGIERLIVGGIMVYWLPRRLNRERTLGLERQSEWQGLLIWVRVRSPEKEAKAQEILMRHGGEAVHIHEIELTREPDDLPLPSLRPDPWLGDERWDSHNAAR